MVTILAFLQRVASHDWEVYQMYVHNAFLHGDIEEEVYMQLRHGFRTADKNTGLSLTQVSLWPETGSPLLVLKVNFSLKGLWFRIEQIRLLSLCLGFRTNQNLCFRLRGRLDHNCKLGFSHSQLQRISQLMFSHERSGHPSDTFLASK